MREIKLSPSLFAADIVNLKEQLAILEKSKVDLLHVDVMDGTFVNRIAFGSDHIRMLKRHTSIPLDVHLMVVNPERHIDAMVDAGADIITVHQEATVMLYHCLQRIKAHGRKAGVVLSPATSLQTLEHVLDMTDMILLMTVNPGEGKQHFIDRMLPKIRALREMIGDRSIDIEVDGSIDDCTGALCLAAGANVFVSGGYAFSGDLAEKIKKLQNVLGIVQGNKR